MIILDLDNCIVDDAWRLDFIDHDNDDMFMRYYKYHEASAMDDPPKLDFLSPEEWMMPIVIITSRPEEHRPVTEEYLHRCSLNYYSLLMRESENFESTTDLKVRLAQSTAGAGFEIAMAYDDRVDVVEAYTAAGIPAKVQAINPGRKLCQQIKY